MTVQEAIEELKCYRACSGTKYPEEIELAIKALEKQSEYKELEEQGLLLRLPCKVGTQIYIIHRYWIDEGIICGLAECDDIDCACFKVYEDPNTYTIVAFNEFGRSWFLTLEKAEAALEKMKGSE